jgi:hypothetical protein
MNKHLTKYLYAIAGSATLLVLYVNFITPDIESPISILGFFVCASLMVFCVLMALMRWKFTNYPGVLLSGMLTLAVMYLLSLHTIRSLDWVDVAVVAVVLTLMIQLMVLPKKR